MAEMRAGLRVPDETDETPQTPVPPPERHPEAACEGCGTRVDSMERHLLEIEAELDSIRALIENEVMATFRHHNLRKS